MDDANAQSRVALQYSILGEKVKADYWYEQAAMASLYEMFSDIYQDMERAAYFYYEEYLSGGNEYAYDNFLKIKKKYNLSVRMNGQESYK